MSAETYGTDPFDGYGHHARHTIHSHIEESPGLPRIPIGDHDKGPIPLIDLDVEPADILPVAIIGAGTGGLYTAMILESLGIPFKIIEASERTGGRLLTHKFPGDSAQYYDVGAMRFPTKVPLMSRLTKLFERHDIKDNIDLIPYKFTSDDNMGYLHYNGTRMRKKDIHPGTDHFQFSQVGVTSSNPDYFNSSAGYDNITKDVRHEYVVALADDINHGGNKGWKMLMEKDGYSTRSYMSLAYKPSSDLNIGSSVGLPPDVINWCETMDKSTGWYDRAFSETVIEDMAFGDGASPDLNWKCLNGGSAKLSDAMVKALKTPDSIVFKSPVTAIGLVEPKLGVASMTTVEYDGKPHLYSHVISTLPLPVLRTLDLSDSKLSLYQDNALRQLRYGPSIKIGIQFRSAWWTHKTDKLGDKIDIVGGQSYTDMPIRTVVYPSYGLGATSSDPAVLIASYCWTSDADDWAGLISAFDPSKFDADKPFGDPLARLVLKDLAKTHNVELSYLADQVMAIHAWSWSNSPYTMGAFAFFGPGNFKNLYPHMTQPAADGRLHFAGEAISARHAWVVGALDSAWRAVDELLNLSALWKPMLKEFHEKWGFSQDWVAPGGTTTTDESVPSIKHNLHLQHLYATQPTLFKTV